MKKKTNKEIIKKTMYENIIAIHNVSKKNYIVKFSTNSIFKKISKDNFETIFF